jgi:hypothetical protein
MEGTQPDPRPDVRGASRGQDDPHRDADSAAGGPRTGASTEYAADHGTGGDVDPPEPPGQG